jgi:pyruvate/2-oxoglutarate dehydrogenase complex dihydrolipoamide acyltransferase (E2) component
MSAASGESVALIYCLFVPGTFDDVREMRVLEWHGDAGTRFERGALIVELETHKAVIEVRADQPGVLRRRLLEEGAWFSLESTLAILSDDPDEPVPDSIEALDPLPVRFAIA